MDTFTRFTQFCVRSGPFTSFFNILLKTLIAILIRNIEVNDNVILWDFDIMNLGCINIRQLGFDVLPFL